MRGFSRLIFTALFCSVSILASPVFAAFSDSEKAQIKLQYDLLVGRIEVIRESREKIQARLNSARESAGQASDPETKKELGAQVKAIEIELQGADKRLRTLQKLKVRVGASIGIETDTNKAGSNSGHNCRGDSCRSSDNEAFARTVIDTNPYSEMYGREFDATPAAAVLDPVAVPPGGWTAVGNPAARELIKQLNENRDRTGAWIGENSVDTPLRIEGSTNGNELVVTNTPTGATAESVKSSNDFNRTLPGIAKAGGPIFPPPGTNWADFVVQGNAFTPEHFAYYLYRDNNLDWVESVADKVLANPKLKLSFTGDIPLWEVYSRLRRGQGRSHTNPELPQIARILQKAGRIGMVVNRDWGITKLPFPDRYKFTTDDSWRLLFNTMMQGLHFANRREIEAIEVSVSRLLLSAYLSNIDHEVLLANFETYHPLIRAFERSLYEEREDDDIENPYEEITLNHLLDMFSKYPNLPRQYDYPISRFNYRTSHRENFRVSDLYKRMRGESREPLKTLALQRNSSSKALSDSTAKPNGALESAASALKSMLGLRGPKATTPALPAPGSKCEIVTSGEDPLTVKAKKE